MSHTSSHPYKTALKARVKRLAGQIEAIDKALARDAPCAELLHQVAGVRGAVNGLLDEIVESHLQEHVARPGLSDEERAQGASELTAVIRRYSR